MELWDVLDENRLPLQRTHVRGAERITGEYHVVVTIWTLNSKGQLLVTLRDSHKDTYPNMWEVTAGSVLAGESSLQGAVRELSEETGLRAQPEELRLVASQRERSAFMDHYLLRKDAALENVTLQPGETVDVKWVTLPEFEAMAASGLVAEPVAQRWQQWKKLILEALENK